MGVSAYQDTVTAMLTALGWHGNHTMPVFGWSSVPASRVTAPRSFTPTTARGWPDLLYVHPVTGVVLACEVKLDLPKAGHHRKQRTTQCRCCPTPEQADWLWRWHQVPCAASVVFRPSDDALQVSRWLSNPETLVSGYGWLAVSHRRAPISRQHIELLTDEAASVPHAS